MKCMNCDKEALGRSRYCSGTCKTIYNRNKRNKSGTKHLISVSQSKPTTSNIVNDLKAHFHPNKDVEDCAGEANSNKVGHNHRSNSDKPKVGQVTTITDVTGKEHPIDFKGRREDKLLLKSWMDGQGNDGQQALASTGFAYSIINGYWDKDGNITARGRQYLNGDCKGLEHIDPPFTRVRDIA